MEKDKIFDDAFNKALSLKNSNKLVESLEIFEQLLNQKSDYYLTYVMMGDIYWDLKNLDKAETLFRKAIELKPKSEKISLCYFHVLWEQGKEVEALDEMKRFLINNESQEYFEILNGINKSG